MRNIKKITAIILALLISLALPMNVFAETDVDEIVIDIDSAISGKTVDDYEDFVSFTATGLQFDDEKYGYEAGYKGVLICKEEDYHNGRELILDELVEGETYTFMIYLSATEGYSIPDDATITVRIDGETVLEEDLKYLRIYSTGDYDWIRVCVDVEANFGVDVDVDEPEVQDGFFQRVFNTIKGIFARIINFFKSIISFIIGIFK